MNESLASIGPSGGTLLRIGALSLVIDPQAIIAVEPSMDIARVREQRGRAGEVAVNDQLCPVYSLTDDLDLSDEIPRTRRFCAILGVADQQPFGLFCDDTVSLELESFGRHPVPVCMQTPRMPFDELVTYGNEVACAVDVGTLSAFIENMCGDKEDTSPELSA